MTRIALRAIVAGAIALTMAASADAQTQPTDSRVFINLNGGYQATSTDFTDTVGFTLFLEEGDFTAGYGVETAPVFDVSGGVMLWRNLAVAVGASRFTQQDDAAVNARLPHPLLFNCDREASGTASSLRREEIAVHLQAIWMSPISSRFEIAVSGGPTVFIVDQDLVTSVSHTETPYSSELPHSSDSFPFDTVTFDAITAKRQSESSVGFNVGADLTYFLFQGTGGTKLGVGTLVRFSRASIDFVSEDEGIVSVDAGGFQVAGGVRLRF